MSYEFDITKESLGRSRFVDIGQEAARLAMQNVYSQLENAAMAALRDGKDFAFGPLVVSVPDAMKPKSLFEPWLHTVECKAGPIEPGAEIPPRFKAIRLSQFTEGELARLRAGRHDWREEEWEDDCGLYPCPECDRGPTVI